MFLKFNFFNWINNYFIKFYSIFFNKKMHLIKENMIMVIVCKHDLIFKKKSFEIKLLHNLLKEFKKKEKKDYFIVFHKYTYFDQKKFSNKNYLINNLFFFINDHLKITLKFFGVNFSREKNYWNKILKKYKPSVIFTISAPEDILELVENKKIPLYEFQHGIIDTKINYFKNLIAFLKKNKKSRFVKFIAWNKSSKIYFDRKVKRNVSLIFKDPHLDFQLELKCKFNKKVILISLANNLEYFYKLYKIKSNLVKFTLPKFLINFIKKDKNYIWIFRFHPSQSHNKKMFNNSWQLKLIKEIFDKVKHVYFDYKFSISNLKSAIMIANYHIADSSAALITSKNLNVNSGCWNKLFSSDKQRVDQFNLSKNSIMSISNENKLNLFLNKYEKKKIKLQPKIFDHTKFIKLLNIRKI